MADASKVTLHVWPGQWDLPSFEPACLASILFMQLALPGQFSLVECSNPDLSPSGQLPFLTHEQHVVSTLPLIMRYVARLKSNARDKRHDSGHAIDADLTAGERVRNLAWQAHLQLNMGDLVAHMMYSLEANWSKMIHPVIASFYPFPQKYYVPGRIRDTYRARLEAVGLWNLPGIEQDVKKPLFEDPLKRPKEVDHKETYRRVFEREKVEEKARASLNSYIRLLGKNDFFYPYRPASIDLILAAHVLLLIKPEYPDPLLQSLLRQSYPTLVNHADRVYRFVFPSGDSCVPRKSLESYTWRSLIPMPAFASHKGSQEVDPQDARYARMRWAWIAAGVSGVVYWFWQTQAIRIQRVGVVEPQPTSDDADGENDEVDDEQETEDGH